jgi:hypothetical protein
MRLPCRKLRINGNRSIALDRKEFEAGDRHNEIDIKNKR